MKRGIRMVLLAVAAAAGGCASQQQQLTTRQPGAIDAALQRARFDLSCPSATATVLSQDYIQPAVQGPWIAGTTRLEYTIGVQGCNQKATYIVMCQEGTQTCFANRGEHLLGAGEGLLGR